MKKKILAIWLSLKEFKACLRHAAGLHVGSWCSWVLGYSCRNYFQTDLEPSSAPRTQPWGNSYWGQCWTRGPLGWPSSEKSQVTALDCCTLQILWHMALPKGKTTNQRLLSFLHFDLCFWINLQGSGPISLTTVLQWAGRSSNQPNSKHVCGQRNAVPEASTQCPWQLAWGKPVWTEDLPGPPFWNLPILMEWDQNENNHSANDVFILRRLGSWPLVDTTCYKFGTVKSHSTVPHVLRTQLLLVPNPASSSLHPFLRSTICGHWSLSDTNFEARI